MNAQSLKSPKYILLIIAIILVAFYLVYYQIPGSLSLAGAAGNSADQNAPGYVFLYQHAYYGGWVYHAFTGEYPSLQYWDASSIRMTAGTSLRIYSGVNFTGQMACLTSDVYFLGNLNGYYWNDNVRSMIVYNNTGCQ